MSSSGLHYAVGTPSVLGQEWQSLYTTTDPVDFERSHFEQAMLNVIRQPNVNSTVILRADMLVDNEYDVETGHSIKSEKQDITLANDEGLLTVNVDDLEPRCVPIALADLAIKSQFVRRIVPRNPFKDAIINQTCLVMNSKTHDSTSLVIYIPHFDNAELCPFYIPQVAAVAILLHEKQLSVHYVPFFGQNKLLLDPKQRVVRTAFRLLQTAYKHSKGVKEGYAKRVTHDVVIDKVLFQDRYIHLKKKYSKFLVDNWAESTDPKKHVFEDIAIAAFLIELWKKIYGKEDTTNKMQFRDLGCGNGVLCYILIEEGFKGLGVDARQRKSWSIYPADVKRCLKEQVIVPSVMLRPHPSMKQHAPHLQHNGRFFPVQLVSPQLIAPATVIYSSADLLQSPQVNIAEFPPDTFIIGNHSDELTCWIPLLGYPFMVIPCCSHNLSGNRIRYAVRDVDRAKRLGNSTYQGLVDRVEYLAERVGWKTEKEMLRIPSTRNAAIIGYNNEHLNEFPTDEIYSILMEEGGADGWVANTMNLMKSNPRGH
ncbi:unnamed protein product [Kluyveromyces dobzhanskii CBS 2104]|uniref:tRNA (uracil-O(2)-)-methyltransferase n=1 Tax=Kluyveromyces dobzhanskii CBS 2104 TaxID=1427455 RepID=A0A0A8L6S3_9SACH|nr:unnamed protein product [Kluyveromyces dobzhanskii CBS 2104]